MNTKPATKFYLITSVMTCKNQVMYFTAYSEDEAKDFANSLSNKYSNIFITEFNTEELTGLPRDVAGEGIGGVWQKPSIPMAE
jgi:hypothetical protein